MAYTKYSLTPASNTAAPPDGAPEGMLPSAVNDTMRDMMSQIRDCGDGIRGGTYTMTAPIITGGSINGATVGATTATTGRFTTVQSTVATGTAPFTVASTTNVANLNASSLNGATFAAPGAIGSTTASTGAFTTLAATSGLTVSGGISLLKANSETYAMGVQYSSSTGQYYIGATNSASPDMVFSNVSGAEVARFGNTGKFLLGSTSSISALLGVRVANGASAIETNNTSGTANYNGMLFYNDGTALCGYINISGTSTAYATTSDYRLKENIAPIANALESINKLKPVDYTWKSTGAKGQGFIAHELQEVCPQAVIGEKDAVDKNGKSKYQGVDTSFLVGMLTKAIQELNAKVDAQAAEIAALKGI